MNDWFLNMNNILNDIFDNEEFKENNYYGESQYFFDNIDKYLVQLDDVKDKIFLAQWCNNFDKVKELISSLSLSEYEKNKYLRLKEKNAEIDETINFKILSEKYSFLDNIMDMITADINIQQQILSLSDSRLKLFELMYSKLQSLTDYCVPYISNILFLIGGCYCELSGNDGVLCLPRGARYKYLLSDMDDLIKNNYVFTDDILEMLLYLSVCGIEYNIPNFNELQKFGDDDSIENRETAKMLLDAKEKKDLSILKLVFLVQAYGLSLGRAKKICKNYNISNLTVTNENKDVIEMYLAIYQIVNERDPDVLIKLYDEFTSIMKPEKDFRRIIFFENDLKKAFAHDLNNQVFKIDDLPYEEFNGVKVYDAGIDFKMIVTAIGAYQGNFGRKENYSEYWNSSKIRSHGNCCSLIGNSNLSMADPKNIILGFSSMNDNMLLLSGSHDLNSTPFSRNFDISYSNTYQEYMDANTLLNNTRGDYNELVYERRDLSSNPKFYKKNPDYIVFFEEYENYDQWFERFKDKPKWNLLLTKQKKLQDELWQESLKAAADFNIPIVKINREQVAKSELRKFKNLVNNFVETKNPEILSQIISSFESSRVGNYGKLDEEIDLHEIIRRQYFSDGQIAYSLNKIKNAINSVDNEVDRNKLYFSLYKAISDEHRKVKDCDSMRKKKQKSGIDLKKELYEIEQILSYNNIEHSMVGRTK